MEAIARKAHICKMRAACIQLVAIAVGSLSALVGARGQNEKRTLDLSGSFEQFQSVSEWTRDSAARTLAGSFQPGLLLTIIARVDTKLCFRRLAGARRNLSATLL
jgi:hypothetical protein